MGTRVAKRHNHLTLIEATHELSYSPTTNHYTSLSTALLTSVLPIACGRLYTIIIIQYIVPIDVYVYRGG